MQDSQIDTPITTHQPKSQIKIIKRSGKKVPLNVDKIHFVVEQACDGITGVSASQIEMNSDLQFADGMTSTDIQEILIRSANDLISLDAPNYQYAAARLLLWGVRKDVFGRFETLPLLELINRNISLGVYDKEITSKYTNEEIKKMNTWIKHDRDLNFKYAVLRQVV